VTALRRHLVSVMAVFFALAIGIVLGNGPLRGESHDTLSDRASTDSQSGGGAQSAVSRDSEAFSDDFASTVAPALIGNRLRGRTVTIVALPTAKQHTVDALEAMIGTAGGNVGGTLRAGRKLVDASDKQLVDELGSQLAGRTRGVSISSEASAYDRIGALIARAVATRTPGGRLVDDTTTGIMSGLDTAGLLSPEGRLNRRGDLVLFVAGPGHGDADQQHGAGSIVSTLVQAIDPQSAGVVLAGPAAAAQGGGELKAVRADGDAANAVSTVDSADRVEGQVVTILALAGQAAGRSGQYGAVGAADGAMPGAR
jgi:hypothetical protein